MNVTFLIGNGFDLGVGMHTRYEDFYKEYCIQKENDIIPVLEFKRMLLERDEKEKIIDWSDFEQAFGEYSTSFTSETKADYLACFDDFVLSFNSYIEKEETRVQYPHNEIVETMKSALKNYTNLSEKDKQKIKKLMDTHRTVASYSFVNFNYTQVLDKCVNRLKRQENPSVFRINGNVLHIHGYVKKEMIMGVNDPSQIKNRELANDPDIVETLVKPLQNENIGTVNDALLTATIQNSDIICIYGMSIGNTDKKWWDMISKWLLNKKTNILIILVHDKEYNVRIPHNITIRKKAALNNFLEKSSLREDRKFEISERIFIDFNKDIFAMKLTKDDNEMKTKEKNAQASSLNQMIKEYDSLKKSLSIEGIEIDDIKKFIDIDIPV